MAQQMPGNATQNLLTQARPAIAAHDHKIAVFVGGSAKQHLPGFEVVRSDVLTYGIDAMTRQMLTDIGTRNIAVPGHAVVGVDGHDMDQIGRL